MDNVFDNGTNQGNVPLRNYIEISDDEDFDEVGVAVQEPSAPRRQNPAFQPNNPHAVPANVIGVPQQNAAPSPPGPGQADAAYAAAFVVEDDDELDVNDPLLAQIMMEAFNRDHSEEASRTARHVYQPTVDQHASQAPQDPAQLLEVRVQCIDQVLLVFPDICRDYVAELYATIAQTSNLLVAHVLDKIDRGIQYPKAKETQSKLKRKRQLDEDEEAVRKYGSAERVIPEGPAGLRPFM
jgi:hypothetical protein